MTKIIVSHAVEFVGNQAFIFAAGLVIASVCHAMFDLSAETAAQNVVAAQLFIAGWTIRGWL